MPTQSFIEAQTAALKRYGVDAEECFVDSPTVDGRAHVIVAGEGPPVVMVNGIGTPAAMWAPLMAQLNGYTLYAVDLPAYGLTDTTASLTDDFRPTAVSFLGEVLDGLGLERPAFVANSLGSLWAMWFAIDRPGRVAALVHVGCPAIVLDTSAPLPMRLLSARPLGRLMMKLQPPSPRQVTQLSKMVNEDPLPPEIADLLLATEQLPGFEATFLATLHTLIRLRGARPRMALTRDQLAQLTQPSLLIFATNDPMGAAPVGKQFAEALPHARLHIVDGGHTPWVHHADQITPLVTAFLNRTTPGSHRERKTDTTS
jgi:pimeloyl-ACP methyl ester carboxylesterase